MLERRAPEGARATLKHGALRSIASRFPLLAMLLLIAARACSRAGTRRTCSTSRFRSSVRSRGALRRFS
jgi:hypothetical protein